MALNPALRAMVEAANAKYRPEREQAASNVIPFNAKAIREKMLIAELDKIALNDEWELDADEMEEIERMPNDIRDA